MAAEEPAFEPEPVKPKLKAKPTKQPLLPGVTDEPRAAKPKAHAKAPVQEKPKSKPKKADKPRTKPAKSKGRR